VKWDGGSRGVSEGEWWKGKRKKGHLLDLELKKKKSEIVH
jgi:hypothetical protein